jgi:predicted naringenin-chalcone synthase
VAAASAHPAHTFAQDELLERLLVRVLGDDWAERPEVAERGRQIARLFQASRVERRQSVVDLPAYHTHTRSTGERMVDYAELAYPLARTALEGCLRDPRYRANAISDFFVVSCTGYSAPGLDVQLARDLGMMPDVRRVVVGHMGCFGGLVGLREALAAVRAHPHALVALLTVELTTLHFMPTLDAEVLTSFALFGDAAAAVLVSADPEASGPVLVDAYCAADFRAADQMSWTITDTGFIMGLSPRIPVSLRRSVGPVVERLLGPHGLAVRDITNWLIHPGGPSILEAIQGKLALSEEQMEPSWAVLREHGNCSSATVLVMLDELLRSGRPQRGEWAVMMAFGPGLTMETCLLRFE